MKVFQSFRLDAVNRCLWHADKRLPLTPKAFDVLSYLVEHRTRLVTQYEILEAVWTGTHVNPEVVKKAVLEIRRVLGDRPDRPEFIETLRKRGYQFIAAVTDSQAIDHLESDADSDRRIVGREIALARMGGCFDRALAGHRQVIFVAGEAGIGKTRLVDLFLQHAARRPGTVIIRGQCIEGFGGKEAYYPVLEALGHFASQGQNDVVELLAKTAPTWLIQFASLVKPEQKEGLQREVLGATRERMVREICEVLEALTRRSPLVLVLEDLHWVDPSTLDVISALARRRVSAKLVVVGTYRSSELVASGNLLRQLAQDLLIHRLCEEIAVEPLGRAEIDEYLARVFPGHRFPTDLSELIRRQSGGNALFMTTLVDDMAERSLITRREGCWILAESTEEIRTWIPATLDQILRLQFEQANDDEQALLTSGSVVGEVFSVWAVSGMLAAPPDEVESICDRLTEKGMFIRAAGIHMVPDGSSSAHYEFRHALVRESACRRLSNLNRSKLHRSYAERLRSAKSEVHPEMAAEIALHFEEARDYAEAVEYLVLTAEHAGRRFAHRDAIQVLHHARALIARIPEGHRASLEIGILRRIGDASYALGAMTDSVDAYEQAAAAAARTRQTAAQIESLISLAFAACYTDLNRGLGVCAQAVEVSRDYGDPLLLAEAQMAAATCRLLYDSWRMADAKLYATAVATIEGLSASSAPAYYQILSVYVRAVQGDYRWALEKANLAIREMTETASPAAYLNALGAKALSLLHLGQFGEVLRIVRAGRETAEKNEVEPWMFTFREAWLRSLCFDFEGVRRLGTVKVRSDSDRHAVQPKAIALVAAGYAKLYEHKHDEALDCFAQVLDADVTPNFFLHWHWRIQAHLGLTAALLRSGNLAQARVEAARCLESAQSTADPNLKALASEMSARVAFADHDSLSCVQHIQNALAIVEKSDLPVTAWRIHAAAWELCPHRKEAERHRAVARDTVLNIANSFDADEPLRASLLSAAPVRQLFG